MQWRWTNPKLLCYCFTMKGLVILKNLKSVLDSLLTDGSLFKKVKEKKNSYEEKIVIELKYYQILWFKEFFKDFYFRKILVSTETTETKIFSQNVSRVYKPKQFQISAQSPVSQCQIFRAVQSVTNDFLKREDLKFRKI